MSKSVTLPYVPNNRSIPRLYHQASAGLSITPPSHSMDQPTLPHRRRRRAALSCVECRRRKIRCDRKEPCTHCVSSKLECAFQTYRTPPEYLAKARKRPSEEVPDNDALTDAVAALTMAAPESDDAIPPHTTSTPQSSRLKNHEPVRTQNQDEEHTSSIILDKSRVSSYHMGIANEVSISWDSLSTMYISLIISPSSNP